MDDEGRVVFRTREELYGTPRISPSGAASAAAPHVGLTPQQRLLLALSELEESRARDSSSRARAADGTDDSSAFAAGSRSAAGEGVAAVGTAATASSGASLACCGDAGADDVSAAEATWAWR